MGTGYWTLDITGAGLFPKVRLTEGGGDLAVPGSTWLFPLVETARGVRQPAVDGAMGTP